MQIITGRICRLLHNPAHEINGFALDSGVDVHFPPAGANHVLAIATAGSLVEVHARLRATPVREVRMDAILVTNLDSKRSASLYARTTSHGPEVSTGVAPPPHTTAPLAPSLQNLSEPLYSEHAAPQPLATQNNVADEIEQAYEVLHRTQAMLAYLKMMKQEESTVYQYLDEAQHTYEQALSRYQAQDFEGAREFAAASNALSRLVEILVSRTFHSNINYPRLVPPPPEHASTPGDKETAQHDLDRVERLLARVRWVTENGTLPSEDRAQVVRLSSWSERLCRRAHRLLETGATEDAIEFAQAADAAVCSAEHLCRKCYVTRRAGPHEAIVPN
jgi:hypothetical protein